MKWLGGWLVIERSRDAKKPSIQNIIMEQTLLI
jgi:hypothetical protein